MTTRANPACTCPAQRVRRLFSQEAKRLGEAFEKPEFRGLFKDYMDEITDPNYRKVRQVASWPSRPSLHLSLSLTLPFRNTKNT